MMVTGGQIAFMRASTKIIVLMRASAKNRALGGGKMSFLGAVASRAPLWTHCVESFDLFKNPISETLLGKQYSWRNKTGASI